MKMLNSKIEIRKLSGIVSDFGFRASNLQGFTLIEAIVALMIFSMAGIFLISASAQNYREVKLNELRTQMENAGIDGINQVKLRYNNRWENLPTGSTAGFYPLAEVKAGGNPACDWASGQENAYLDESRCDTLTELNNGSFLRSFAITDATKTTNGITLVAKQVEVIVTCKVGKCDSTLLPPYRLRYLFYR